MIEVKNITKSFEGRTVLNDISAVFLQGRPICFSGTASSDDQIRLTILERRTYIFQDDTSIERLRYILNFDHF